MNVRCGESQCMFGDNWCLTSSTPTSWGNWNKSCAPPVGVDGDAPSILIWCLVWRNPKRPHSGRPENLRKRCLETEFANINGFGSNTRWLRTHTHTCTRTQFWSTSNYHRGHAGIRYIQHLQEVSYFLNICDINWCWHTFIHVRHPNRNTSIYPI